MGISSLRGPSGQIHPDTNINSIRELCIYYLWMQTSLLRHWKTAEVILRQLVWSHQCRKQVMGPSGINSLSPEGSHLTDRPHMTATVPSKAKQTRADFPQQERKIQAEMFIISSLLIA